MCNDIPLAEDDSRRRYGCDAVGNFTEIFCYNLDEAAASAAAAAAAHSWLSPRIANTVNPIKI